MQNHFEDEHNQTVANATSFFFCNLPLKSWILKKHRFHLRLFIFKFNGKSLFVRRVILVSILSSWQCSLSIPSIFICNKKKKNKMKNCQVREILNFYLFVHFFIEIIFIWTMEATMYAGKRANSKIDCLLPSFENNFFFPICWKRLLGNMSINHSP